MKYQDNQHFSHNHILNPLKLDHGHNITCKACEQTISDPDFHGCIKCSYYLHDSCLNTPRSLLHSSHPSHPLTLHPTPLYPTNSFTCNACHSVGNSFSLSCAHCDYDLHIQCANLPDSVLVVEKHPHEMKLIFKSPYDENSTNTCDVCKSVINTDHWFYVCESCDFGSHLDCIEAKPLPKLMNNDDSVPAASVQQQQQPPYYQQPQDPPYYSMYPGNTSTPGVQYPPPQVPNVNTSKQQAMDDMAAVNKAQEEIDAAHAYYALQARGRRAALDLIDDGNHGRRYSYI